NPVVGCGDVRMRSQDSGDAAIKVPAEGDFFAGGFGVDVEQDDLRGDLREQLVNFAERIVAGGHKDAALQVEDGVLLPGRERTLVEAKARCSDGVVGRADDAAVARMRVGGDRHVLEDFFLVPDVVAGGDDVRA